MRCEAGFAGLARTGRPYAGVSGGSTPDRSVSTRRSARSGGAPRESRIASTTGTSPTATISSAGSAAVVEARVLGRLPHRDGQRVAPERPQQGRRGQLLHHLDEHQQGGGGDRPATAAAGARRPAAASGRRRGCAPPRRATGRSAPCATGRRRTPARGSGPRRRSTSPTALPVSSSPAPVTSSMRWSTQASGT